MTLAVICFACVYECCVRACASSSLSAVPGIVYNTTQRRVYIFVFFSHARHVQLVILCAYHRMSYFAWLPQRRRRCQPALACLLSLPVLFVFFSPFWQASKKAK